MRVLIVVSLPVLLAAVAIAVPIDSKRVADRTANIDSDSKTLITQRQGLNLGSLPVVSPPHPEIVGPPPSEDE